VDLPLAHCLPGQQQGLKLEDAQSVAVEITDGAAQKFLVGMVGLRGKQRRVYTNILFPNSYPLLF